ncbi:hypothetical protein [Bradyrhizobium brasilense]|uniref:Glycosyltransferase family 1 protein n=1 Tax=Bradyrhizobium brasilense TaxID=1419277 RepID=A0ABY8JMK7_9BRAD|nr:hypothetical protein [Bradyrhizobium brasilense]WFU66905.1 hypothetical protein QA636_16030 [Bradyrhizobium brasilense]
MRILILHELDDLASARRTSINHAFALLKYAPQHEYTLQSARQPVTARLREQAFDAIILDTTFLCWRWARPRSLWLDRLLDAYRFVAQSDAVKVALPQDEYDHAEVLDAWLADWKVDLIYSVCFDHHEEFYPRARRSARVLEALTGYVDDVDIGLMQRFAVPFDDREIDVGYRARALPAYFGRIGQLKAELGERFRSSMAGRRLKLDISTQPGDAIVGDGWLQFLGNSRFTLGCESGSSLLDPRGEIRECVERQLQRNRTAGFEELEQACFAGQDMRKVYTAAGPRLFEAAIARSCQILTPGNYAGALNPGEHYIALAPDCSNAEDVYEQMQDKDANQARIEACYRALVDDPKFRYRNFVAGLLAEVRDAAVRKGGRLPDCDASPGAITDKLALRESFTRAVLRAHQHHIEDVKEIRLLPNFLHVIVVTLVRQILSLARRIRG